ncbi:uncharacterized protein LOC113519591 [Galleria mellonella]|uniref:Trehalase n=1 Tax=Galleria mellonella TaxID=7137 RepID=A0ABM3N708_GALME|nr:uncharacterized protein LOC113519591 [Galleria mellonella]
MMWRLVFLVVAVRGAFVDDLPPSCSKLVYCDSQLLHHVQLQRIFKDSKTFVDLQMRNDQNTTLAAFDDLLNETNNNPTAEQLKSFVDKYFDATSELEDWTPEDHTDNPAFLQSIRDEQLKKFGKDINGVWPILGRKVKPEVFEKPEQYSLVPVSNGFIIPGGRFKEIYYWDTYWIIEGLLISGMRDTARGVIENLIEILKKFGHIPNGSRWYYQERSQPPLLTAMMSLYIRETQDIEFLKANINALEDELKYWLDTKIVAFDKDEQSYTLLRYFAPSLGPRPESYYEDYTDAQQFDTQERRNEFYIDLKSAAESGWDFSSRWFIDSNGENTGDLKTIRTRDIIPVDLNAIFANALQNMAYFRAILKQPLHAAHWAYMAKQWKSSIEEVLWNEEHGIWYDYDISNNQHRRYFYPTNIAPLWMGVVDKRLVKKHAPRVMKYLSNSPGLKYPGGIPASLINSGEQWDFPNAWPPLVSMVVNALEALGTDDSKELAFYVAQTWVRACHKGFTENKQMFEKYDAETPGRFGGGGEYTVQFGFGWSNGVVLEFLTKYGRRLTAVDNPDKYGGSSVDSSSSSDSSDLQDSGSDEKNPDFPNTDRMLKFQRLSFYPVLGLLGAYVQAFTKIDVCNSSIYCSGDLLHKVQLARIYPDSKTFVDLKLVYSENDTLDNFAKLMDATNKNPSREALIQFVNKYFVDGNELSHWSPPDFDANPPILEQISDPKLKQFAKDVIQIWARLGRKVNPDIMEHPGRSSLIYVPNGFIVPGGRFKELYYWDSYWMVRGLIISNMTETAKGMIENLLYLVEKLGYMPNGSRLYYLGRSHPPLLTAMVASYFTATGDLAWLAKHIATVEKELHYWLTNKKIEVELKGKKYMLLRYIADKTNNGPRPESYYEDFTNAQIFPNDDMREEFYLQIKSAAESGWDFSSRWFMFSNKDVNLTSVHPTSILPVDLNSIFAGALEFAGDFRNHLKNRREAQKWWSLAKYWRSAIANVLWDSEDGIWYDYDLKAKAFRKQFYPSCATPLWTRAVEVDQASEYGARLAKYLSSSGAMDFPGGVPTSISHSGEQWDFPNAWPPLQSIIIGGLYNSGDEKAIQMAKDQAKIWIRANYIGYTTWQKMFEKYNVMKPGHEGSGGEYSVQDGFGWTNGIVLELLQRYGKDLTLNDRTVPSTPYVQVQQV